MKKIIIAVLMVLSLGGVSVAEEMTFAWDASVGTNIVEYRLYQSVQSMIYPDAPVWVGPALTATVDVPNDNTYHWVVTAVNDLGRESGFSNELTIDMTLPPPPENLKNIPIMNVKVMNVQIMNAK